MRLIGSLIILSLILVACGSDPAPTATPSVFSDPTRSAEDLEEQFATEEVDEQQVSVLVTPQTNVEQSEAPLPGTLAFDPEASDENIDAMFDRVIFRRYGGGPDAPAFRFVLQQDGNYELNAETTGILDSETVNRIDSIIRDVNFFAINTPMLGPGGDDTNYRYQIYVERAGDEMTINAEDGYIPQTFQRLIGAFISTIATIDTPAQ